LLALLTLLALPALARDKSISAYGPISVGRPNAGFLINARRMPDGKDWVFNVPKHAYATDETIEQLSHCLRRVRAEIPDSARVMLGSLSAKRGGKVAPHDSHRTGRDADVYFFRQPGARWYEAATREDTDLKRTWALLRCFITDADVDFVLIDNAVQGWLEEYALGAGEPRAWVRSLFHDDASTKNRSVVRHAPGHVAHMHVRFVSPRARLLGAQLYERLVREGYIKGGYAALQHRVLRGDTLGGIGRKYHVPIATLKKLNGLVSSQIRVGQRLIIRQPVELRGAKDAVHIPPRRRPPA